MIDEIQRLGLAPPHEGSLRKSLQAYRLYYSFPKYQGRKVILGKYFGKSLKLESHNDLFCAIIIMFFTDMDPLQNTVEDLILRISIQENISGNMTACLFTADGMPLTDDPFFNTC